MSATQTQTASTSTSSNVRRPQSGLTAAMWDLFDSATGPITTKHIRQLAEQEGWNLDLTRSHFRQWRKARAA